MLAIQVHTATSQGWEVCDRVVEKHALVEAFSGDEAYRGTKLEFVEAFWGDSYVGLRPILDAGQSLLDS